MTFYSTYFRDTTLAWFQMPFLVASLAFLSGWTVWKVKGLKAVAQAKPSLRE